jgi:hypothetical protein
MNAASFGNTMTTVGTGAVVVDDGSTRRSASWNPSNFAAVARSSRALTSPTTMKLGVSMRRHAAEAGVAMARRTHSRAALLGPRYTSLVSSYF